MWNNMGRQIFLISELTINLGRLIQCATSTAYYSMESSAKTEVDLTFIIWWFSPKNSRQSNGGKNSLATKDSVKMVSMGNE